MKFAKKSLGQNFLIDKNIIKKIINLTNVYKRNVLEIGPGLGALTDEILDRNPNCLYIIEKDFNLAKKLKEKYSEIKKIKVFNNDILDFEIEKVLPDNSIIFGNLPYNISSQILVKILKFAKWPPKYKDLIFMFQKEVGKKIIGKFPSKNYGRLSILTNYKLSILESFLVSPNCFSPKPKVNSMVIHFRPKNNNLCKIKNIEKLEKVTNIMFSNKRKMINKNIIKLLSKDQIKKIKEINLKSRPTEIRPETYYKITELYQKN